MSCSSVTFNRRPRNVNPGQQGGFAFVPVSMVRVSELHNNCQRQIAEAVMVRIDDAAADHCLNPLHIISAIPHMSMDRGCSTARTRATGNHQGDKHRIQQRPATMGSQRSRRRLALFRPLPKRLPLLGAQPLPMTSAPPLSVPTATTDNSWNSSTSRQLNDR